MSLSDQLYKALTTFAEGVRFIDSRTVLCGSEYAFRLPLGLSCHDIEKRADVISAAAGAPVEVIDRGGAVIIRVVEKDWPARIQYDPAHLKNDMLLIGYNRLMKPIYHRLMHLLVGGAAGGGKTVWLRWVLYQLVQMGAIIRIADLKGFSFFPFESAPGVEIAKTLEDTADMLFAAVTELERREHFIMSTRNRANIKAFKPYVVVIDEAAQISPKMNKSSRKAKGYAEFCEEAVARLAQKGRETKVILIYCTQKPTADIVNGQVKANVETALAFRTNTYKESDVIINAQGAEKINIATPGRCIYKAETYHLLQVPFISESDEEWEKLLAPLKTEVLYGGHSRSSRGYLDGVVPRTGSDHQATRHVERQFAPAEKGIGHPPGLGTGTNHRGAIPRTREGMAAHAKGTHDLRGVSSSID
ncbi:hypothetical protein [Paenibacillus sp. HJGM_3]|uniref:hypothetical protein n=1 Tax=Paenibacillus sp. HJGM_3 TaxID=3379816 RepID=UPI00385AF6DC